MWGHLPISNILMFSTLFLIAFRVSPLCLLKSRVTGLHRIFLCLGYPRGNSPRYPLLRTHLCCDSLFYPISPRKVLPQILTMGNTSRITPYSQVLDALRCTTHAGRYISCQFRISIFDDYLKCGSHTSSEVNVQLFLLFYNFNLVFIHKLLHKFSIPPNILREYRFFAS